MIDPLKRGEPVAWHSLGLELEPLTLASARDRGLSEKQARRLERHDPKTKRVMSVVRRTKDMPGEDLFREGDLVLALDGEPVSRIRDLVRLTRGGRFEVQILRDGQEKTLEVEPSLMSGEGTTRAVLWAGALLQAPHPALASQYGIAKGGVYVSRHWFGAPSTRYGVEATSRIVKVDGQPVADLDAFLSIVSGKKDRDAVRLDTLDLDGKPGVITLKLDLEYWPTFELRREKGVWQRISRRENSAAASVAGR
jgi:S1-C subfamily serine protease